MAKPLVTSEVVEEVREYSVVAQPDSHLDRLLIKSDLDEPWYKSIVRGVRELVNPPKLPPLELTSRPVEGADFGDLDKVEQPWFKSFFTNVRDLINPPKLPPLELTSKPVEVGTIWGAYGGGETRSGAVSLAIHIALIALMLGVFRKAVFTPHAKPSDDKIVYVADYKPKLPV